MSLSARNVLLDCKVALEILEDSKDVRHWRVHWAGAISLLRAVGHVLQKVDRRQPEFRNAIDQRFALWKQEPHKHQVFWDFIKTERDSLLKEYVSSVSNAQNVALGVVSELDETGSVEVFGLDENIYKPILSGYGETEDARDVYQEAIEWWELELSEIEKMAIKIT